MYGTLALDGLLIERLLIVSKIKIHIVQIGNGTMIKSRFIKDQSSIDCSITECVQAETDPEFVDIVAKEENDSSSEFDKTYSEKLLLLLHFRTTQIKLSDVRFDMKNLLFE